MQDVTDNLAQHESTGEAPSVELTPLQYRKIAEDIRRQPSFRQDAMKAYAYYHGKQLTPEEAADLEAKGMGELIANMVKPSVNVVLGTEVKTRTDWRVQADRDEDQDMAEALSMKLKEAERETRADAACSSAYADQIIAGWGCVFVGRNMDPFGYPLVADHIPRNEVYWDWQASKHDGRDMRYFVREKWYPIELLEKFFPQEAMVIRASAAGWTAEWMDLARNSVQLMHAFDAEQRTGDWIDAEWRNTESGMALVREVWYRHFVRGLVVTLPDLRVVEFDRKNPVHVAGLANGMLRPRPAVYSKLRVSLWVGPHKIADADANTRDLPYKMFWGYREDDTKAPYGIVRDMIPMQDEINARRRKLLWLLSAKRILADSDALDKDYNDFGDLVREAARPDMVAILDPNRRNANAITIENDLNLSTQQYQVMKESQEMIQQVAGIFNAMMGRADGVKANSALQTLVDQGTTGQADLSDNYRDGRTLVGQGLLDLILQDMDGVEVQLVVGEEGRRKTVTLNRPMIDELTGLPYRENDTSKFRAKVALADVPSTPAYRTQAMVMIAEVIKGLPPQLQAPLVPYFLESTDLPKRKEMADVVRKMLGLGDDGGAPDPEKQQLMATIEQLQMAIQQGVEEYEGQIKELTTKLADLGLRLQNKAAENARADALAVADIAKKDAETAKIEAETLSARANAAASVVQARQPQQPQEAPTYE